jgi:hypothetical protein
VAARSAEQPEVKFCPGRLLRLARTIDVLGGLPDEIMGKLVATEDFVKFLTRRWTEEQAQIMRPLILEWLDIVKAEGMGESRP